jgi:mRNA interferase MazF
VKRGEIWTLAGGLDDAGKPRPALILQEDRFDSTGSITVCPFTTDMTDLELMRVPIEADSRNGLRTSCRLMLDKVITVPRDKLGRRIGRIDSTDLSRLSRAIVVFLGLGGAPHR